MGLIFNYSAAPRKLDADSVRVGLQSASRVQLHLLVVSDGNCIDLMKSWGGKDFVSSLPDSEKEAKHLVGGVLIISFIVYMFVSKMI